MKKELYKAQQDYIAAKAVFETYSDELKNREWSYLFTHNIKNPNGKCPERIYQIMDDDTFEKVAADFEKELTDSGFSAAQNDANLTLYEAEEKLIVLGLKIVPDGIAAVLRDAVKTNYNTRYKLLDLLVKLDASTVPA